VWANPPTFDCASSFENNWSNTCGGSDLNQAGISSSQGDRNSVPHEDRLAIRGGYPFYIPCKIFPVLDGDVAAYNERYEGKYHRDDRGRYHNCQSREFQACVEDGGDNEHCGGIINQVCEDVGNAYGGYFHFDHVGGAMMCIFQVRMTTQIRSCQSSSLTCNLSKGLGSRFRDVCIPYMCASIPDFLSPCRTFVVDGLGFLSEVRFLESLSDIHGSVLRETPNPQP